MRKLVLPCLLVFTASPALAQQFSPSPPDPRVRIVTWEQDRTIPLTIEPGGSLTVILPANERIANVTVGDSSAFQVTVPGVGDSLSVKPLTAFTRTSLTVMTDARQYLFTLDSSGGPGSAYVVMMNYGATSAAAEAPANSVQAEGSWKLSGDATLRPRAISDDGVRTYIQWAPEQALPAVFAIDARGREEVVDGYMRDLLFVIDRIHPRLVFRIDRAKAVARRREVATK